MTSIALLRHGPTQWNADGRLQGRRDTELNESGRA
ncbi:MAG: histidine phosphatase family protein, partial [Alphaproteobacteria bacterium]|nr:histidine phosphatase family protein [Alphaproteobacteria bacterium]